CEDVVTRARLRLCRDGDQVLHPLRRDVVDRDVDLLFGGPLFDESLAGVVAARDPVIPEADREPPGCVGAADIRRGDECRGSKCGSFQCMTSRDELRDSLAHRNSPIRTAVPSLVVWFWFLFDDMKGYTNNASRPRRDLALAARQSVATLNAWRWASLR